MNELHLFAGAGGGILGGELLGHRTVCAVEIEEYPRKVLLQRQRDGILPWFPIWDDITTFDARPWKGRVDLVSGGFPCQDISAAGKGAGIDGERSGLWGEMARVVCEVSPRFVFVENSPMLTSRGLHRVLGDLVEMGYDARWCVLGADDAGAPHRRKRIWILAFPAGLQCDSRPEKSALLRRVQTDREKSDHIDRPGEAPRAAWWYNDPAYVSDPNKQRLQTGEYDRDNRVSTGEQENCGPEITGSSNRAEPKRDGLEPVMGRVAHGVANRVDRLKAIGNGQVPAVAALAFTILSEGLI